MRNPKTTVTLQRDHRTTVTLHRNAVSGRLVKPSETIRRPNQTTTEIRPKGGSGLPRVEIHRDAGTGRFVPERTVRNNPSTTVTEQRKRRP